MAPPPPYTAAQIAAITSPEEQLRARAELTSYIARIKKERQDRLDRESYLANDSPGYTESASTSPYRNTTGTGYDGSYNSYQHPTSGSTRGGYSYDRGASSRYHPYQRPGQRFKNKSVTFNNTDSSLENPEPIKVTPFTFKSTYPRQGNQTEAKTLCPSFTLTGVCTRHGCRYLHDPEKQAICKSWLFKGTCSKGGACALSHEPSPQNLPTCLHFQDGRCNKDDCRFAHVKINAAAPNCEAFGLLGYCGKGADCPELHAHECPHFSNTGSCFYGDRCRLGHVHRASRMRIAARQLSEGRSLSSDSPEDNENETTQPGIWSNKSQNQAVRNPHQFTQQADFVPLDSHS